MDKKQVVAGVAGVAVVGILSYLGYRVFKEINEVDFDDIWKDFDSVYNIKAWPPKAD